MMRTLAKLLCKSSSRGRHRIPVTRQEPITMEKVSAAKPPNPVKAKQIDLLRKELAIGLVELSRSSDQLATEVLKRL